MDWFLGHPRDRTLGRYVDGGLDRRAQARLADHLAGCQRCREEVTFIRRAGALARSLSAPPVPGEPLTSALRRRDAGERMLLPVTEVVPRPDRPRFSAPGAAAAVLVLLVAAVLASVDALQADRPGLTIAPEAPRAGEVLRLEYDSGQFAGENVLSLRARYRTRWDNAWTITAAMLAIQEDGTFRGELALPDSAVYAVFAVEDAMGERLDTNHGELWEVVVHGSNGRPTLDGLWARSADLIQRNWATGFEAARELTRRYPNHPRSWSTLLAFEAALFDSDSITALHRERYRRLAPRIANGGPTDPEGFADLALYAAELGDIAGAEAWLREARTRGAPARSLTPAEVRLAVLTPGLRESQRLTMLETAWARWPRRNTASVGLQLALDSADPVPVETWLKRLASTEPERPAVLALDGTVEAFHPETVDRWVRSADGWLHRSTESRRPLTLTTAAHRRGDQATRQRVLAFMAERAYAAGDRDRAADLARQAVSLSWETEALLRIGRVLAEMSDSAAKDAVARAAADPSITPDTLPRVEADPEWLARVQAARQVLHQHVRAGGVVRYLPDRIRVWRDDEELDVRTLTAGRPAVVAFLSRYSRPSLDELGGLAALQRRLGEREAGMVVIEVDAGPELAPILAAHDLSLDLAWDRRGEARMAFGSAQVPDYFVLDALGRVRFEHGRLADLPRQLEVLDLEAAVGPPLVAN